MDWHPVGLGEAHEGGYVEFGIVHQCASLGDFRAIITATETMRPAFRGSKMLLLPVPPHDAPASVPDSTSLRYPRTPASRVIGEHSTSNGAETTCDSTASHKARSDPALCAHRHRIAHGRLRVDGAALSAVVGADPERLPRRRASHERPTRRNTRVAQRHRGRRAATPHRTGARE